MLTLTLAELLELQLRRTFRNTNTCAIVSAATFAALKPDIFPFAFLFSHKNRPNQAGLRTQKPSDYCA
jgi:hypothetical protein